MHGLLPFLVLDLQAAQAEDPRGVDPAFLVHLEGIVDEGADLGAGEVAKLNDEIKGVSRNSAGASQGLQSMAQRYIGIAALTTGVIGLTKALFDAGLVAQKLQSTLSFATGSASNAAQEYQFIRKSVNELGLDLNTSSMSFAKLAAAAQGTKIQGQGVRDIFTAISQASTVMGLSAEESNGALYAISQMISKGTVASEELRGQLGERLPGAFQIAARAMGVSTAELGKMLEQGQVISDEFLPRFAAELSKTFEGSLPTATKTAQAEINRLSTAWTEFKRETADSVFMDVAIGAIKTLTAKVKGAADDIASAKQAYKRAGEDLGGSLLQGIGIALSKSPDILFSRMGKQMIAVAEASYRGTAAYAQDLLRSQTAEFGDEGALATLEAQGRLSRGKISGIAPPTAEDKAFTEEWNKLYLIAPGV